MPTARRALPSTVGVLTLGVALQSACPRALAGAPPAPLPPVPTPTQRAWHEAEFYALMHFGPNTFTDKEWGYGDVPAGAFNPTAFDADQICGTLARAGARAVILVAKHHDGFCLWPSAHTDYSVKSSPWRSGRGDAVREMRDAAQRAGLGFGFYLSPWDRHHAAYGRPEYIDYYRAQLRELCTEYGPLFMCWFDGANGGDGYYGGARESRVIDRRTYYDWPTTWKIVRELQPSAAIFSDIGPDVRWVGNESGFAGETCWATYSPVGATDPARPGVGDTVYEHGVEGTRRGTYWMPAECDVPLRKGWFWHAADNDTVRSPGALADLYFQSVGRGGALDLGIAPDTRGILHENDVRSLEAFGAHLRAMFSTDFAMRAPTSPITPGAREGCGPERAVDGDRRTSWIPPDGDPAPGLIVEFGARRAFSVVRLREGIDLGQRIGSVAIDVPKDGGWTEIGAATSIGSCRLIRLDRAHPVSADRLRVRVTQSDGPPAISEIGVFLEPGG